MLKEEVEVELIKRCTDRQAERFKPFLFGCWNDFCADEKRNKPQEEERRARRQPQEFTQDRRLLLSIEWLSSHVGGGINPKSDASAKQKETKHTTSAHLLASRGWNPPSEPPPPQATPMLCKYTRKSERETDRVTSVVGYLWRHSSAFRRLPAETAQALLLLPLTAQNCTLQRGREEWAEGWGTSRRQRNPLWLPKKELHKVTSVDPTSNTCTTGFVLLILSKNKHSFVFLPLHALTGASQDCPS